jgi:ribonuclease HI
MKEVTLYTDGSCKNNPGPGGWCCIMVYGTAEKMLSGGEKSTTNNRMELTAAIEGLSALKEPCRVRLVTDSRYLVDAITKKWAQSWKKRGWVKADKSPALNSDLWERVLELCEKHDVVFEWVRGHDGHEYNERCDAEAQRQADLHK